jgi:hypothetical protein
MRPIPYIILFLFSASLARAQQVIDVSTTDFNSRASNGDANVVVNGLVYSPFKFVRVTAGTPFFKEEWMKGTLVVDGGKAYSNLWLRLNLLDNEINYKDAKGQEMVATSPIKYITLTDSAAGAKYDFVRGAQFGIGDNILAKTFFQVLVNDNKVSLCRQITKRIHEAIAYGTATTEQDIVTVNFYYVRMNGNFSRFKWDDWQEIFKDKKDQLSAFIKTNHLKGKTEEDFTKLVKYYNTL